MAKDLTIEECEAEIARLTDLIHLKYLRAQVKRFKKEVGE